MRFSARFRGRGIGALSPALAALAAAGGIAGIGVDASAAMRASPSAPDPAAVSTRDAEHPK